MKYLNKFYFIFTGIISLFFYLFTISPTVLQTDAGELAAVQVTLGIAHPTGYPLYTIIGYLISLIPLPFSKIFQLNLLAAIYCSTAVSVFTYTFAIILNNLNFFKTIKQKKLKQKETKVRKNLKVNNLTVQFENDNSYKIITAVAAVLILAFSKTFWMQSTSVEVYSFQLLLFSLIILSLINAFIKSDKSKVVSKYWLMFAVFLALGFSNHMTTLLIIPGAAYLYFVKNGFNKKSIKQIFFMLLVFLPILVLTYSYLPIRASQNPVLNWGNPIDLEKIIRHVTGKQYQVWIFSSIDAAKKQLNYFLINLPKEFYISSLLILFGIWISFKEFKKLFMFLLIVFLSTVLYGINYEINDIDAYFLLAYISLAFFGLLGIQKLYQYSLNHKIKPIFPISILSLFLIFQFAHNFSKVDQNHNYTYEDYTKTLLKSLPQNSIVFSYQWDYFISASYYFQFVEDIRRDVIVIDKELLRRSWYYHQLKTNHPEILNDLKPEVTGFLTALKPFEMGKVFNPNVLENYYRKIMTGLIEKNINNHDYFIAPEIVDGEMKRGEFNLPNGYSLVPYLFLYKVVKSDNYLTIPLPDFKIRFSENKDKYILSLKNIIASMLANRALYELHFNQKEQAKIYAEKIAAEFKEYIIPPVLQKLINN